VPRHDHTDALRVVAISLQVLASPLESADAQRDVTSTWSGPMRPLMALAQKVAPLNSTVLITGESGVGKERLARWLHQSSPRAQRPFVAINCGAITETLLESELFGHVRGAFTGANQDRPGMFEAAHSGTLFLDEVGDVSPTMQVRLLRVIQEREVVRVGETKPRPIDVRLIAATNKTLHDEVLQGRFRRDLYYRLRVIELHVPPLRERPDELLTLAHDLLVQTAARLGRSLSGYTPRALERVLDYAWPGNIRELQHAIERACVLADGPEIDLGDLPSVIGDTTGSPAASRRQPLAEREFAYIRAVLERHHGNRRQTAAELGISLSTLKRRLKRARETT
jgi:transcriptional regulator with PAS, ATPase and Fis domain